MLFRKRQILRRIKKAIKAGLAQTTFYVGGNPFLSYSIIHTDGGQINFHWDGTVLLNGEWILKSNTTQLADADALWLGKKLHFWIGKRHKMLKC